MLRAEPSSPEAPRAAPATPAASPRQQQALVRENLRFVWRSLWSLGVARQEIDDAVQQVFLVATRKQAQIEPGRERSFLFGVATRVAKEMHRSRKDLLDHEEPERRDSTPSAEELVDHKRARNLLDRAIESIAEEQRTVFVLFEVEGMKTREIADALDLPMGTVASRLRLAREQFRRAAKRLKAQEAERG